jgi:hypothetical protein
MNKLGAQIMWKKKSRDVDSWEVMKSLNIYIIPPYKNY